MSKQSNQYKFKTTRIKGKEYVEVNQRVLFFRQEEKYKDWSILTELDVKEDDSACIVKAIIANQEGRVVSTGYAREEKAASMINKTSFVENCETSAIGRALAMLGIGIETSIASANEVQEAISQGKPDSKKAVKPVATVEDDYQKAVTYLKNATDVTDAWEKIEKQSKTKFSPEQYERLVNFVKNKK
jgi:hypothetical protein